MSKETCATCNNNDIIRDNHCGFYRVCNCRESEYFLEAVEGLSNTCDCYNNDESEDEK